MGYDLHITRKEFNADEGNDISKEEWLSIVAKDPELSIDDRNGPCFALWKNNDHEDEYWLDWFAGNIYSKNPDQVLIDKMIDIAKQLNAKVQGDDGELYDEVFQLKDGQQSDMLKGSLLVFDISSIIEINNQMLIYKDDHGDRRSIDFHECRNYWVKYVNESKKYVAWEGQPCNGISENDTNCVGQRDWFAEKPYFEFFTTPVVRFEIHPKKKFLDVFNKNWRERYYQQFHSVSEKLDAAGWSTFDLG